MLSLFLQYSAVYVKKHLIENLVAKIKVLKLLTYKNKVKSKEAIIKTIERILHSRYVTKSVLDFVGLSLSQYKSINPQAQMFANQNEKQKEEKISNNLVMSPRVKLIEELPLKAKEETSNEPQQISEGIGITR